MSVIKIHNVDFDGMTENIHYARPEIETVVRAGSGKAVVQVRRETSPNFELYPWVFVYGVNQPYDHIASVRELVGKKVKIWDDVELGLINESLIVMDFRHRARRVRDGVPPPAASGASGGTGPTNTKGFLIQYTLQCISTLDTPINPT